MNPFGRLKAGRLATFLPISNWKEDRGLTLALKIESLEKRLGNVEQLILFQEQERLVSSIKLGTYIIIFFQIGKVTDFYFSSDWAKDKFKKAKFSLLLKGKTT